MRKMRKLVTNPGVFFRDFLVKKYPYVHNEQKCPEINELAVIEHALSLEKNILNISNSPVDIVYTWVNKNSVWEKEYSIYSQSVDAHSIGQYATDSARFEDHDELLYSIKSVRQFLPWVRNIFVVTNNLINIPEYLVASDIVVIAHDEIIDTQYLPTFNSHVIEAHLHRIDGLSENFIYFNDDVFVARPLPKEHFFQSNELASLFVAQKSLDEMYSKGQHTPTLLAAMYCRSLLKRDFGCDINHPLVHTYVPLKKSIYERAWQLYQSEIVGFLPNRFRGQQDLNIATFLVPWMMYVQQMSSIGSDICYYFNIRSPHAKQQYKKLLYKSEYERPHSLCANDFHSTNDSQYVQSYKKELISFLSKYF